MNAHKYAHSQTEDSEWVYQDTDTTKVYTSLTKHVLIMHMILNFQLTKIIIIIIKYFSQKVYIQRNIWAFVL